jgi:CheY-like chemotaxis protein
MLVEGTQGMPNSFGHVPKSPHSIPRRAAQLHVLVVDDSRVHQTAAIYLLTRMGHQATVVNNGKEALEAISKIRFDAVLMDVVMPEMDGLTATRKLRQWEVANGPRVLVIGATDSENRRECLDAGMDAYLTKPLQSEALQRTLDSASSTAATR